MLCYTNTCSLNFDGSDTYDPDGSTMSYSWSLSGKIFASKKNPTVQEYGLGEHTVEFTVTDSSGKISRSYYTISVL
ncbi:MAG: PKD domain-containing protein [Patescibacteria group bacterium]